MSNSIKIRVTGAVANVSCGFDCLGYSIADPTDILEITQNDSGEIKTKMKSYPVREDSGEENKYDPDTGYKLLTGCANCNRAIQQLHQAHCF